MTVITLTPHRTPFAIKLQKLLLLPHRTLDRLIDMIIRIPPQILPVVRVDTTTPIMRQMAERTELGLVLKHKEVGVVVVVVQKVDFGLLLTVGVTAEFSVFAGLRLVRVGLTEPLFVLGVVVERFVVVVAVLAVVAVGALLAGGDERAELRHVFVFEDRPPSVVFAVVVNALFGVFAAWDFAGEDFEGEEVEVLDWLLFLLVFPQRGALSRAEGQRFYCVACELGGRFEEFFAA